MLSANQKVDTCMFSPEMGFLKLNLSIKTALSQNFDFCHQKSLSLL